MTEMGDKDDESSRRLLDSSELSSLVGSQSPKSEVASPELSDKVEDIEDISPSEPSKSDEEICLLATSDTKVIHNNVEPILNDGFVLESDPEGGDEKIISDIETGEDLLPSPGSPAQAVKGEYRLNFSPGDSGLVSVPENGLLTTQVGQADSKTSDGTSEQGGETNGETQSESNSTAISASLSSRTGGYSSQFTKAEPLTAKQQVALWLTRTSTQDLHQEFSVMSLRSLVNPSSINSNKYKKCRVPCSGQPSSNQSRGKTKEIVRNFSTKSLMERFSGSQTEDVQDNQMPSYTPIRKCETVLALSRDTCNHGGGGKVGAGGSTTSQCGGHSVVHRHKRIVGTSCRSSPRSSRTSLFKRFSKCGSEVLPVTKGINQQKTAPGELCASVHPGGESPYPFPGLRPVNRLRSKSSIIQCSRCTSVMSVATSRMTSRATSQMSLLMDKRYSRVPQQDDVLCKICLYDCPVSAMVKIEDCGCTFCKECMQQYINFEVMEGAYDISCPDPDCPKQGVLNQHQMERLTDKELLDKHRTFRLNTEVSMDAARTWCPSAGCDTICHICAGTKSQGVPVSCPSCQKEFCSLCSATWHPGLSCSENGAMLVKRGGEAPDPFLWESSDENIKRCPMCSVPIERDAGCAQMMCKRCKHVFCWYCLTSLDDDFLLRHYDSGECQGKLGHSRASVIWHRAQVIGIFAGFGILLLVASPLLLVAAPCIICCKCRACTKSSVDKDSDKTGSDIVPSLKGSNKSP